MSGSCVPPLLLLHQPQHVAAMCRDKVAAGGPVAREVAAATAGAAPLFNGSSQKHPTILTCKLQSGGQPSLPERLEMWPSFGVALWPAKIRDGMTDEEDPDGDRCLLGNFASAFPMSRKPGVSPQEVKGLLYVALFIAHLGSIFQFPNQTIKKNTYV